MTITSTKQETKPLPSSPTPLFKPRTTSETISELLRPIDPRHVKTLPKGNVELSYVPWATICLHLHHRAPGWTWDILEIKEIAGCVVVSGKLTIPTSDGVWLYYSGVASEPIESSSMAPPVETAASSALRRAAALAGVGIELWC